MTALFFPIFGHYTPIPDGFALPEPEGQGRDTGWASVRVGSSGTAQGPVLRRFRDGRVTVDGGGREITGRPVGQGDGAPDRGSWWQRLTAL